LKPVVTNSQSIPKEEGADWLLKYLRKTWQGDVKEGTARFGTNRTGKSRCSQITWKFVVRLEFCQAFTYGSLK